MRAPFRRRHLCHDGGRQNHHARIFAGRFHFARGQASSSAPARVGRRRPHRPQHPRARQRSPRSARSEDARRARSARPGAVSVARHRFQRGPDRSRAENFPDRLLAHRDFLDHADAAEISARAARKSHPASERDALRRPRAACCNSCGASTACAGSPAKAARSCSAACSSCSSSTDSILTIAPYIFGGKSAPTLTGRGSLFCRQASAVR